MIHSEIKLEFREIEGEVLLDMDTLTEEFWKRLYNLTCTYVGKKKAAQAIMSDYFDLCVDDLEWTEDSMTLIFSDAAGYCLFSRLIAQHWALLVLSINKEGFIDYFRAMGWELKSEIPAVEEIVGRKEYFYFEHKGSYYAINRDESGEPYIVCDQGSEIYFEKLTKKTREKLVAYLDKKECQCPICVAHAGGKLKRQQVYIPDIKESENYQTTVKNALKYHRVVDELSLIYKVEEPLDEIGKLKKLRELNLITNGYENIPPEFFQLTGLEKFDCSESPLKELPEAIGELVNLEELNIINQKYKVQSEISSLPATFSKLQKLDSLSFEGQPFKEFPREILELESLTYLFLERCGICSIPPEITRLSKLEMLAVGANELSELPPELFSMKSLTSLDIKENPIKTLPPDICKLTNLTHLSLWGTEIEELPEELGQLTGLKQLVLGESIKSLPKSLANCPELVIRFNDKLYDHFEKLVQEMGVELKTYWTEHDGRNISDIIHENELAKKSAES